MAINPDALAWIAKADEDANVVAALAKLDTKGFGGSIAYHCQQRAEKYLKSELVNAGVLFPKVHDFERLLALCSAVDSVFGGFESEADRLQPFAVEVRYPHMNPDPEEVQQAIVDMNSVRDACRRSIGLEW